MKRELTHDFTASIILPVFHPGADTIMTTMATIEKAAIEPAAAAVPGEKPRQWLRWFAWHPVKLEGSWRWLVWVERREGYYSPFDELRSIPRS